MLSIRFICDSMFSLLIAAFNIEGSMFAIEACAFLTISGSMFFAISCIFAICSGDIFDICSCAIFIISGLYILIAHHLRTRPQPRPQASSAHSATGTRTSTAVRCKLRARFRHQSRDFSVPWPAQYYATSKMTWGPNADGYQTLWVAPCWVAWGGTYRVSWPYDWGKAPGGNRFYGKTVAKWGRERAAKSIFLPAT